VEVIPIIIGLIDKLLDKLPDFKDRERKRWVELKQLYTDEINKPLSERDADKILNIRDTILLIGKELAK
jgi:hypothetical protein